MNIDKIRSSGGTINIGDNEDGVIVELFGTKGRLVVIKERSIYEVQYADTIDPERKNVNLPPLFHKIIINKGAESEIVSRILITAKTILKPDYLRDGIDCDSILSLVVDLLSEFSILEEEIYGYKKTEKENSFEYEKRKVNKQSFQLPAIVNLESKCTTIFQKADQIEQILMEIATLFLSNRGLSKQSHFPKLHEELTSHYGAKDNFTVFIDNTVYFMRIIRELRNGFDHRLATVKITDFEIQLDGNILTPTIELIHKDITLKRMSLNEFLEITLSNLILISEMLIVYFASKNIKTADIQYVIKEIPEEKRLNKFVRYCFWLPVGVDGYYCQK
jgi:hypothetical protein